MTPGVSKYIFGIDCGCDFNNGLEYFHKIGIIYLTYT